MNVKNRCRVTSTHAIKKGSKLHTVGYNQIWNNKKKKQKKEETAFICLYNN